MDTTRSLHTAAVLGHHDLCERFEKSFVRDAPMTLEEIVDLAAGRGVDEIRLFAEALQIEVEQRRRRGERPAPREYKHRFPTHHAIIDDVFRPSEIGRYRVLGLLGEGGFGRVYLAKNDDLPNRRVAIKVPHEHQLPTEPAEREKFIDNFLEQARITAELKHGAIVGVHDAGRDPCFGCYFAMEYIDGKNLAGIIADRRTGDPRDVAGLLATIADAVAYAHGKGILHLDLKPENVLLDGDGRPHLSDFGLALHRLELHRHEGRIAGTPHYMAPEQCKGDVRDFDDGKADVYALGVIFYELLSGRRPFSTTDWTELRQQILNDPAVFSAEESPGIPEQLIRPCLRCLEKRPEKRPTAAELAAELSEFAAAPEKAIARQGGQVGEIVGTAKQRLDSVVAILSPLRFFARLATAGQGFTDREWLFDKVDAWAEVPGDKRFLRIVGEAGSGKSAFIAELIRRDSHHRILAHHICCHDRPASRRADRFVRSIAGMLAERIDKYREVLTAEITRGLSRSYEDPADFLQATVIEPLHHIERPGEGVFLIVIDALDEADLTTQPSIPDLVESWSKQLPDWLRIIASMRRNTVERGRFPNTPEESVDVGDDVTDDVRRDDVTDDVRRFVRRRLMDDPDFAKLLSTARRSVEEAAKLLVARSGANFLVAKTALEALKLEIYSIKDLDKLPRGLDDIYSDFFKRSWPTPGRFARVRPILEVLLAAKEAMTDTTIRKAAGLDDAGWGEALDSFAQYLDISKEPNAITIRPRLKELLASTSGIHRTDSNEGHKRLADAGWSAYETDAGSMARYFLRYLPGHLAHIGEWAKVEKMLTDPAYLEALASCGAQGDGGQFIELSDNLRLLADRRSGRDNSVFRLMDDALRLELPFLERHPECLFQTVWNALWWHDASGNEQQFEVCPDEVRLSNSAADGPVVSAFMEEWHRWKTEREPGFTWLRSLRPPFQAPRADRLLLSVRSADSIPGAVISAPPRVLTATADGKIRLWDARSGACLHCQDTGTSIRAVFLLDGGTYAVVHFADGRVASWRFGHPGSGGLIDHSFCEAGSDISRVELSPSGRRLAIAQRMPDGRGRVSCYDVHTKRASSTFNTEVPAYLLEFSPDDAHLAVVLDGWTREALLAGFSHEDLLRMRVFLSNRRGTTIELWRLRGTAKRLWVQACGASRTLKPNPGQCYTRYFLDGTTVFFAGGSQLSDGENVAAIYFPTEDWLVTENRFGRARQWRVNRGTQSESRLEAFSENYGAFVDDASPSYSLVGIPRDEKLVAISADRRFEVVRRASTSIEVVDKLDIARRRMRIGDSDPAGWLWEQLDERRIVQRHGFGDDSHWRVWDWTTASHLACFRLPGGGRLHALDSANQIAIADDASGGVHVIEARGTAGVRAVGNVRDVTCLALSQSGDMIALADNSGDIHLQSIGLDRHDRRLTLRARAVASLAFSPIGDRLGVIVDNHLLLYDLATQKSIAELELGAIGDCLAFSPDGSRQVVWSKEWLSVCDADNTAILSRTELYANDPDTDNESAWRPMPLRIPFVFTEEGRHASIADGMTFITIDLATGGELRRTPLFRAPRLRCGPDTTVALGNSRSPIAAFQKFSRAGAIMPDGRTIVLAHAGPGRLEILRLEGRFSE